MNQFRLWIPVLAISLLAGCAHVSLKPSATTSAQSAQQEAVAMQLDAAMQRVKDQPRWSESMDSRAQFASFATNAVSVSYQGSAASLLKAIAAARGKSFKVTGPSPHLPIFVFVKTKGQPYTDFMRDLEKQFGQRAEIVLTDTVIELRYRQ